MPGESFVLALPHRIERVAEVPQDVKLVIENLRAGACCRVAFSNAFHMCPGSAKMP
jgi:hypothetical protein